MNSQDIIRIGCKAKTETEAFINRYLNDQAKGWPRACLCNSVYMGVSSRPSGRAGLARPHTAAVSVLRGLKRRHLAE